MWPLMNSSDSRAKASSASVGGDWLAHPQRATTIAKTTILMLFGRKCVGRGALKSLPGPQNSRREVRFVRGIGKMLAFQAEAAVLHMVAGIELEAGFGRVHLHYTA